MRIVYFNHNVIGTGTYLRAYRLAREVARAGHDVTVVTTSSRARYGVTQHNEDGVTVIEAPDLMWGSARTGWDPWNTIVRCVAGVKGAVDLIHAFDARPAVIIPALHLRNRTGATLAMDWADWWGRGGTIVERSQGVSRYVIEPVETWFEERFRARADVTTTICRPLLERVVALGVARERAHLVPNGCVQMARVARAEARHRLNVPMDVPLLVHLGASFRRDIEFTLAAFRDVTRKIGSAELVFVGRLPIEIRGEAGVRAIGRVPTDDVALWLAAADACVLPLCDTIANRGRWPSKVNEYLAAGRPVAITDVGDVANWIRNYDCGVVAAAEPHAFGQALLELLSNEALRVSAAHNALALAAGPLAWTTIARSVMALYEKTRDAAVSLSA
ncbi:MAG: glycosyltransferase [Gemmatimonadota bacterium]